MCPATSEVRTGIPDASTVSASTGIVRVIGAHTVGLCCRAIGPCRRAHLGVSHRQRPVTRKERGGGEITVEQAYRAESAGVVEPLHLPGQLSRHADPDARVQGRGDDCGQPSLLNDPCRATHPTQGLHLDDEDVGCLSPRHGQRVLGPANRLVGGDGHLDRTTYLGEFWDARAWLFDVLQPSRCSIELIDGASGLLDVPTRVRIHPNLPRSDRVTHRLKTGTVLGQ